jgi:hypothetical protein
VGELVSIRKDPSRAFSEAENTTKPAHQKPNQTQPNQNLTVQTNPNQPLPPTNNPLAHISQPNMEFASEFALYVSSDSEELDVDELRYSDCGMCVADQTGTETKTPTDN